MNLVISDLDHLSFVNEEFIFEIKMKLDDIYYSKAVEFSIILLHIQETKQSFLHEKFYKDIFVGFISSTLSTVHELVQIAGIYIPYCNDIPYCELIIDYILSQAFTVYENIEVFDLYIETMGFNEKVVRMLERNKPKSCLEFIMLSISYYKIDDKISTSHYEKIALKHAKSMDKLELSRILLTVECYYTYDNKLIYLRRNGSDWYWDFCNKLSSIAFSSEYFTILRKKRDILYSVLVANSK